MTAVALDVLASIRRHGGDVKMIAPDCLKVRAPMDLLPDFVRQVRAVKPELIAALSAMASSSEVADKAVPATDVRWWQRRFTAKTFQWLVGNRDWEGAKRLAWGDLQNEWHVKHGRRWPIWQCAGCGQLIGGLEAIDLPDGNRVHRDPIDCLIIFGKRWRAAASAALIEFGLQSPSDDD